MNTGVKRTHTVGSVAPVVIIAPRAKQRVRDARTKAVFACPIGHNLVVADNNGTNP